jgi:hypothetical protein
VSAEGLGFCLVGLEADGKGGAQKWEVRVAAARFASGDQEIQWETKVVTVGTLGLGYGKHRAGSEVLQYSFLRCFEVVGKGGAQKWEARVAEVQFASGDREL